MADETDAPKPKKAPRKRLPSKDTGTYRVRVGINYGPNDTRAEAGDVVSDLPAAVVGAWLAEGVIEKAGS